jgi:hypothetical protein
MKRTFLLLGACVITFFLIMSVSAFAQSYEALFPLLINISGWDADSPEGMDMSASGMKAITAAREYEQGNKGFSASIIVGIMAQGMWNPAYQEGFSLETNEVSLKVERIKGFFVMHSFEKDKSGGAVIVLISEPSADGVSDGAIFAVSFENMDGGDGMKLAQKFDWNAMKAQVANL